MSRTHYQTSNIDQGWGQIRFIKYKYKYKYKNLDFSNTNTNTNILFNFHSNTNTNTSIQIQIQIRSTKYICRNCSDPNRAILEIPRYMLMVCVSLCLGDTWSLPLCISRNFTGTRAVGGWGVGVLDCWIGMLTTVHWLGGKFFFKIGSKYSIPLFFLKYKSQNYTNFPETWKKWGWNDGAYFRHEIVQFFNWFLYKSYLITS